MTRKDILLANYVAWRYNYPTLLYESVAGGLTLEVTAAVIWKGDEFLICQRPKGKNCELLWEFPGGKVEPGETLEECVARECQEELGVGLRVIGEFADIMQPYPDRTVHLHFFHTEIVSGELIPTEHNAIAWITQEEAADYAFCPADARMLANHGLRNPFYGGT